MAYYNPQVDYSSTPYSYGNDGYNSSNMQRSPSEGNRSTDSNQTHHSAGVYQSQGSPVSAGGMAAFDYSVPGYVGSTQDTTDQDADYYFNSLGAQYQNVDQYQDADPYQEAAQYEYASEATPDYTQAVDSMPLLESKEGDDEAAHQATMSAQQQLSVTSYKKPRFSIITDELVDQTGRHLRRKDVNVSDRKAVQKTLQRYLSYNLKASTQDQTKIHTALYEAACQLLLRVQGDEAYNICYFAIGAVLAELRGEASPTQESGRSSSISGSSSGGSQRFVCLEPGCKQGAFGRAADLERHHRMVHLPEEDKKKFFCDYKKCTRHEHPFYRQDHFRDHMRDFHKEDLLRRGTKADQKWWLSRSSNAIFSGWWRCNRCLVTRVDIQRDGWVCPNCSMHCETERQRYRMKK